MNGFASRIRLPLERVSQAGRATQSRSRADIAPDLDDPENPAHVIRTLRRLLRELGQVTTEEFRWQDSHYGQHSRYGRELLFLAANNEWTRATHEIVDITRSDSVDTQIEIEIDLDQITHEAFRSRPSKFWLPLLILPGRTDDYPLAGDRKQAAPTFRPAGLTTLAHGDERRNPESFANLTVRDAFGRQLPLLPDAEVWHRISAALAEIVLNIAVARWSGPDGDRPTSTRDQRLLLSAAIYRLLRRRSDPGELKSRGLAPADIPERRVPGRLGAAEHRLTTLLNHYIGEYQNNHGLGSGSANRVSLARTRRRISGPSALPGRDSSESMLTRHAVEVLDAFSEATVVAVAVESEVTPTVFTVRAPTRHLLRNRRRTAGWPRARLLIDLLLPSADADRQVQVNLPDGVSFDNARSPTPHAAMRAAVSHPEALRHLCLLLSQLEPDVNRNPWTGATQRCLADLAAAKAEAAIGALSHHQDTETNGIRDLCGPRLTRIRAELQRLSSGDEGSLKRIRELWQHAEWLPPLFYRPTTIDTLSPRAAVARVAAIEDPSQRATPASAQIEVNVAVSDAEFFSIARFASVMSVLLTSVALTFFAVAAVRHSKQVPSAEVLAASLTLFSVIQAGRLRHPDISTLRGLLSTAGNWLIVCSVMPAVVLAIALAFHTAGWVPVVWAGGSILTQLSLVLLMSCGPLSDTRLPRRPPRRLLHTWPVPDYQRSEALHSSWWRSTTAEALMIGKQAHAYLVWEHEKSPALSALLAGADVTIRSSSPGTTRGSVSGEHQTGNGGPIPSPANVLALLRSGTSRQALTFIVFREQPAPKWARRLDARPIVLDPDRLAPLEASCDLVDIFIGLSPDEPAPMLAEHPLVRAMGVAADHHVIVLDARHPVPSPSASRADWRWSRLRVGLRGADVGRISDFLSAVCRLAAANSAWELRIQMSASCTPQLFGPRRRNSGLYARRLVLDSDLDPVSKVEGCKYEHTASSWRFMTICADERLGIEYDLLEGLADSEPQLRLAGMNFAIMHGMAVIILLGCQQTGKPLTDSAHTLSCLQGIGTNICIPVDEWQNCMQLGHARKIPVLRVRIRNQDRPGTMRDLLDSLGTQLRTEFPSIRGPINTWYAQSEIAAGHAAFTRLSAPLPIQDGRTHDWPESKIDELARKLEQIEKEVRLAAIRAAAAEARHGSFLEDGATDEPVVSLSFIESPVEQPFRALGRSA